MATPVDPIAILLNQIVDIKTEISEYEQELKKTDLSLCEATDTRNAIAEEQKTQLRTILERQLQRLATVLQYHEGKRMTKREGSNISLLPVAEVKPPRVLTKLSPGPKWTAPDDWLDIVCDEIDKNLRRQVGNVHPVPPMAVIRCIKGGKTRALKEIAQHYNSKHKEVTVIYVSFHDDSRLVKDEKNPLFESDPFAALYRRIAFAARTQDDVVQDDVDFQLYRSVDGSSEDILEFVGGQSCLLIIDELNMMREDHLEQLAPFLEKHFLDKKNRYLLFSSNLISTPNTLISYMETVSSRGCIVKDLPLISSLQSAASNLGSPDLTPMKAVLFGKIPSLIYLEKHSIDTRRRDEAIASCIANGFVVEDARTLLSTFVSGEQCSLPDSLLQLMTTSSDHPGRIRWILVHMVRVLKVLHSHFRVVAHDGKDTLLLHPIVTLLQQLPNHKVEDGATWETLFIMTLLIRYVTFNVHDDPVLPKPYQYEYTTSYNSVFDGNFNTKDPSEFLQGIDAATPPQYPHVAVYYPTHAKFKDFDVIVAIISNRKFTHKYAYQLKDGKPPPKEVPSETMDKFDKIFWVRGEACQNPKEVLGWYDLSEDQINLFLGVTGTSWAPANWKVYKTACDTTDFVKEEMAVFMV